MGHVDFDGWQFVDRNTPAEERDRLADTKDPLIWCASFHDLAGRDHTWRDTAREVAPPPRAPTSSKIPRACRSSSTCRAASCPNQMKMQVLAGSKAPFPYEAPVFAVRHTVWYMPDVASCFAMRDLLAEHQAFRDYEIVVAAGARAGQGLAGAPAPGERAPVGLVLRA